jgi:hypothetical protein
LFCCRATLGSFDFLAARCLQLQKLVLVLHGG